MIDLHVHSTFSDGSLTPVEIVELGVKTGLSAIALTDHDCTDGIPLFLESCEEHGIKGIVGVEISAEVSKGTLHMLGYHFDLADSRLQEALRKTRDGREIRNGKILERLNELGADLKWEEVSAYAGEDVVGRPHFARAMVEKGFVSSKTQAFDRYLAKGKSAYVDRCRMTPEDSIQEIRGAGGVAVLAHPFTLDLGYKNLDAYVGQLAEMGLQGMEVYYSEHSPEQVRKYRAIAENHGLLLTGGSDFHGDGNPGIKLGYGFGNLNVSDDLLVPLDGVKGSGQ